LSEAGQAGLEENEEDDAGNRSSFLHGRNSKEKLIKFALKKQDGQNLKHKQSSRQ